MFRWLRNFSWLLVLMMVSTACGSDDPAPTTTAAPAVAETDLETTATPEPDRLAVIATTTILGDLVANVVGGDAQIDVLLPPGADPHDYQISASQAAMLYDADLVVANGLGLEEGLIDVLEAAEADGVNVLEIADQLDPIPFSFEDMHGHGTEEGEHHDEEGDHHDHDEAEEGDSHDHDEAEEGDSHDHDEAEEGDHHDHDEAEEGDGHDHDEAEEGDHHDHDEAEEGDGHDHDEAEEGDGHDHDEAEEGDHDDHEAEEGHHHDHAGGLDPHFWTDPLRVAQAAILVAEALAAIDPSIDWAARAEAYAATLTELDEEIQGLLASIPADNRKLITNHDSLGYFADRYGFEVIGAVIPGGATLADPSSAQLAALVEEIVAEGVKVIFAETIEPTALAEAVAAEAGTDVQVVTLHTGSLGEPGTATDNIVGMLRDNASKISAALT